MVVAPAVVVTDPEPEDPTAVLLVVSMLATFAMSLVLRLLLLPTVLFILALSVAADQEGVFSARRPIRRLILATEWDLALPVLRSVDLF